MSVRNNATNYSKQKPKMKRKSKIIIKKRHATIHSRLLKIECRAPPEARLGSSQPSEVVSAQEVLIGNMRYLTTSVIICLKLIFFLN